MAVKIEIKRHAAEHETVQPARMQTPVAHDMQPHTGTEEKETGYCPVSPMKFDNNLWRKVDAYTAKHDRHFNDKLAEYAISQLVNMDESHHRWSVADVKAAMEGARMYIHRPYTYGDMAYAANMAYADFYPDVIHEPIDCLRYAYNLANDPDGYDGEIFNRWTADIYAKGINIDWDEFI